MSVFFAALLWDVEAMHDIVKGDLGNVPMYPPEDDPNMVKAKREATICRFCHQPLPELDPVTGEQLVSVKRRDYEPTNGPMLFHLRGLVMTEIALLTG